MRSLSQKKWKKSKKKFWKFKNKYYLCTRKQETTSLTINNKSYRNVKWFSFAPYARSNAWCSKQHFKHRTGLKRYPSGAVGHHLQDPCKSGGRTWNHRFGQRGLCDCRYQRTADLRSVWFVRLTGQRTSYQVPYWNGCGFYGVAQVINLSNVKLKAYGYALHQRYDLTDC